MKNKVLIVDDSAAERYHLGRLLEKLDIDHTDAKGGEEAIELLGKEKYEYVFLDIAMPFMTGLEVFDAIGKDTSSPNAGSKFIFVGDFMGENSLPDNAAGHLNKPVLFDELKRLIEGENAFAKDSSIDTMHQYNDSRPTVLAAETEEEEIPEWLRNDIESLDVDEGIKHCGSEDGYMAAIQIFYDMIDQKSREIEELFNVNDIQGYTIKVHALKSSARIVGASHLSNAAYELEMAGKDGDTEKIKRETNALLEEYRGYKDLLKRLGGDDDNCEIKEENRKEAPFDVIEDAFSSLVDFAGQMEFDLCEMVLDSLKEYKLAPEIDDEMKKIRERLNELDFEGLQKIIKSREKVLIVDDDAEFMQTVGGWLCDKYEVKTALGGEEAYDIIRKEKIRLILLDYVMPGEDGPVVYENIKHIVPDVPIMFLTGAADRESIMHILSLKPIDYLLKNLERDSLRKKLGEFFAGGNYA